MKLLPSLPPRSLWSEGTEPPHGTAHREAAHGEEWSLENHNHWKRTFNTTVIERILLN